mmetsp:Transcript_2584/g.4388  ORF Transcript_2584/g.4388 Transcript_2584/m.4388 type:complete len:262 (-) Transcript_2584:453-1238(-)
MQDHLPVEDPAEVGSHALLLAPLSTLCQFANTVGQLHEILLRLRCITTHDLGIRHVPPVHQMIHDVSIVKSGVGASAFCHSTEVMEQFAVILCLMHAIVHEVCGHHNLLAHHVCKSQDGAVHIMFHDPINDLGICDLMAPLVCCDQPTDLGQRIVTMLHCVARSVAMRDLCCPLLEGGVHKAQVRVVFCLGIHATSNKVLDGHLHGLHVHAACEVHVLVHHIAVAIFLCSPCTCPVGPGSVAGTRLITHPIQGVEHAHISW